jgi:hypothetical protein
MRLQVTTPLGLYDMYWFAAELFSLSGGMREVNQFERPGQAGESLIEFVCERDKIYAHKWNGGVEYRSFGVVDPADGG